MGFRRALRAVHPCVAVRQAAALFAGVATAVGRTCAIACSSRAWLCRRKVLRALIVIAAPRSKAQAVLGCVLYLESKRLAKHPAVPVGVLPVGCFLLVPFSVL